MAGVSNEIKAENKSTNVVKKVKKVVKVCLAKGLPRNIYFVTRNREDVCSMPFNLHRGRFTKQ